LIAYSIARNPKQKLNTSPKLSNIF